MAKYGGKLLKVGKKFCFPEVPSGYLRWTARLLELFHLDDGRSKHAILHPHLVDQRHGIKSNGNKFKNDAPKDGYIWSMENCGNVQLFMGREIELCEYPESIKKRVAALSQSQSQSPFFDVISLLCSGKGKEKGYLVRNNIDGDKVDIESLRGKNMVICCFWVPLFWLDSEATFIRGIKTACLEVFPNSNYEMVIVAKMLPSWAHDEDAFNHFLSGFPSSCLVVPFSDTLLRDYVCHSLDLNSLPYDSCSKCLLVDSNQNLVLQGSINLSLNRVYFPVHEPDSWWETHSQLDAILDSVDYVCKINPTPGAAPHHKLSLSELKGKLVGLYLCYDGAFIHTLNVVHQHCKSQDLDFEVVLVYIPYRESVDPVLFQEAINHVLRNLKISDSWWVSPYDEVVSRRLWQVCRHFREDEDKLIILDPHHQIPDPYGKYFIEKFGFNAYPFTRESLIVRELQAVRALTLESLLVYGTRDFVLRMNLNNIETGKFDKVPVAELRGKTVLLYADSIRSPQLDLYHPLLKWYHETKGNKELPDFEVVFFHLDSGGSEFLATPWLSYPFDPQHLTLVTKNILKGRPAAVAAFGNDGHIITLDALNLLDSYGPNGFPSHGDLRSEVLCLLRGIYEDEYYDMDMPDK